MHKKIKNSMKIFNKISEDRRKLGRFSRGLRQRRKIRRFSSGLENNTRKVIQRIMCSAVSIDHAQTRVNWLPLENTIINENSCRVRCNIVYSSRKLKTFR